ncbi:MAG: DUF4845 domain-containing protein [Gammaproteobacteria bacterium]|nr:DUF4845 domain-containing protein [Gammaproteobacteria bacterium]
MNFPSKQRGMTVIAMALVLGLVAFFANLTIKLFPIYMEHFNISSHLDSLASENSTVRKSDNEIFAMLKKRFDIDDVTHVANDDIFIERAQDGSVTVAVEYEVRTNAFGNVDVVVSFSDEVEIR